MLALQMNNITKHYPGVVANDNVTIEAQNGSIVCIIGENGAGKSTLMNILYGMERPDEGQILLNGQPVEFTSSRDAMKHHIGMVFQHFMLVDELSCMENIILGMEPTKGLSIDVAEARRQIQQVMDTYDMNIPLDKKAGRLWVGLQQKLEILKILYRGAEIIILDEPTAVLTPQETQELFVNMRKLAQSGKTIFFITHKLDEVMAVADDIYVMRAGKLITRVNPADTSVDDLALKMVGHELPPMKEREGVAQEVLLQLDSVTVTKSNGIHALEDVSLTIHSGEIFGIAGISGNGQNELAHIVAGLSQPNKGSVHLRDKDITSLTRKERIGCGVSYIPEDRNAMGACLNWSIEDNCIAGYHDLPQFSSKLGKINRPSIESVAREMIEKFMIKTPSSKVAIKSMSGGNCQKVIVARETSFNPTFIIASEPSRGIDIHAINSIHRHMINLRNEGCGILLLSSSLDEIFQLSDRIGVIYEGKIVAVVDPKSITREEIGLYMSGAKRGESA